MAISYGLGTSALIPGVVADAASRPVAPYEGQVIFQKDTDQLLVWNGTAWVIPNSPAQNPTGLELVKTQTVGAGVSSVTVTDAFSATHDNYKVTYFGGACTTDASLRITLGGIVAGYYGGLFGVTFAANTPIGLGVNNQASFLYGGTTTVNYTVLDAEIYTPFVSGKNTMFSSNWVYNFTNFGYSTFRGELANSASVSSITITPSAGTLTGGTIRVYGYRK